MKRFKSIVVATFAAVVAVAFALPALPAQAASSAALSIVPKKNYTIEAGKTVKDKLVVRNLDREAPLQLSLRVVDFTFTDDGGTPKLMLAEDAPQTTWSLKPFLKVPKTVTIDANSTESLDMNVSIPAGHGAGSYYSAIVYSSGGSDEGNVGLSASGVTLVFASIPGKVTEDLKLQKFGAYQIGKTGEKSGYKFITANMPEAMAYTLTNGGNVTEAPVGSITLKDMFGHEYVVDDVNPNKSLALIGQTRTFTACIKLKSEDVKLQGGTAKSTECTPAGLWPGFYTASLDVFYGQNGNNTKEIVGTAHFFYLPWWFVIVSILVLLIIAYFVRRFVLYIRHGKNGARRGASRRR